MSNEIKIVISEKDIPKIVIPNGDYKSDKDVPEYIKFAVAVGCFYNDEDFREFVWNKWNSIEEDEGGVNVIHTYIGENENHQGGSK